MPNTHKRVLVYQSYGKREIIEQTIFSMASLFKHIQDVSLIEIQVFTDQKSEFEKYFGAQIVIKEVSLEMIDQLKGPLNFVHRVKPELLIVAARNFHGPLFYADSDTIFLKDPTELFLKVNDRTSLMHISEGQIGLNKDPLSKKLKKFLKNRNFTVAEDTVTICPSTVMWNAGFVGISENNKPLLVNVLELTDRLYSQLQKHTMEQLAFSYILQTKTEIEPASAIILHYWDQKNEYQKAISEFLSQFDNLEKAIAHWQQFNFPAAPRKSKKYSLRKFRDVLKNKFAKIRAEKCS